MQSSFISEDIEFEQAISEAEEALEDDDRPDAAAL